MTLPPTPPDGYTFCQTCGLHLAIPEISVNCPICDDGHYSRKWRANHAIAIDLVRLQDAVAGWRAAGWRAAG